MRGDYWLALPAEPKPVALYLSHLADGGKRLATIQKALAALVEAQRVAGLPSSRELTVTLRGYPVSFGAGLE